jgi:hypothetical protein
VVKITKDYIKERIWHKGEKKAPVIYGKKAPEI